jgi:hypothetical protein
MASTHKMISKLFGHWGLDGTQQSTLFDTIAEDESTAMALLQIHTTLRLLYPNHSLRYEWITCCNRKLNGDRPIDIMLRGSEGIQQINKMLRHQLLR